jgi:hypothetical protein
VVSKGRFEVCSREAGAVDPSHTGLLFRCDCLGFEHASLREPFVAADVGRSMTGSTLSGCSTARWCTSGAPVRLRTRSAREGTQVHPADLDDALCTSGALASRGAGGETLLPFAVDDARLRGATRRAVRGACCGCHRKCPLFVRPAPALTIRACLCSQAVARQGAAAVSVRLGGVDGQSRAQLDGFKSRALRPEAPAQRHLYATEWRVLAATPAPAQGRPTGLVLGDAALPFEDERVPSRTRWNELDLDLEPGVMTLVV